MNESKERNVNIQGLRAIAFLLVFLSHASFCFNSAGRNVFSYLGPFGVEIFIVLSGCLSYRTDCDKKSKFVWLIKKIVKLYPLHIITLVLSICLFHKEALSSWFIKRILVNAFLIQSWFSDVGIYYSFNAVSWYLSVHVFFVFCSPLIVRTCKKIRKPEICIMLIFLCEVVWCCILANVLPFSEHWLIYVFPPVRLLDYVGGVLVGKIISERNIKGGLVEENDLTVIGWLAGLAVFLISINFDYLLLLTSCWLIPTVIIVKGVCLKTDYTGLYANRVLVRIGNISMPLFLFHYLIINIFEQLIDKKTNVLTYVFALILSIIVADLITFAKTIFKYMLDNARKV